MPTADVYKLLPQKREHSSFHYCENNKQKLCWQNSRKWLQHKMARMLNDLLDPQSKSLSDFSSVGAKKVQAQHQLWGLSQAQHLKAAVILTVT